MTTSVSAIGTSIKKVFVPFIDLLNANKNAKVSVILDQLIALALAASGGQMPSTVAKNAEGVVVALRCGYFKQWMPLSHVEFGHKAGSASGYSNSCKEGLSNWHKQQRAYQNGKEALFAQVLAGTLLPTDAAAKVAELEAAKDVIIPHSQGLGFDTAEQAVAATKEELDAIVAAHATKQPVEPTPATDTHVEGVPGGNDVPQDQVEGQPRL